MSALDTGSDSSDADDEIFDMRHAVTSLVNQDQCGQCLLGKAAALETFLSNTRHVNVAEKVCVMTALSILYAAVEARAKRVRATGERDRFHYYVPFVGRVCKPAFLACFRISSAIISRYRRQVRRGVLLDRE